MKVKTLIRILLLFFILGQLLAILNKLSIAMGSLTDIFTPMGDDSVVAVSRLFIRNAIKSSVIDFVVLVVLLVAVTNQRIIGWLARWAEKE